MAEWLYARIPKKKCAAEVAIAWAQELYAIAVKHIGYTLPTT